MWSSWYCQGTGHLALGRSMKPPVPVSAFSSAPCPDGLPSIHEAHSPKEYALSCPNNNTAKDSSYSAHAWPEHLVCRR